MTLPALALLLLPGCQHLALQVTSSSLTVDSLVVERSGASFEPGPRYLAFDLRPGEGWHAGRENRFVLAWEAPDEVGSIALIVPEETLTDPRSYVLEAEGCPIEVAIDASADLATGTETLDPAGELVVLFSEGPLHEDMRPEAGDVASFEATLDATAVSGPSTVMVEGLHVEREVEWVAVE